jgi:hypothetical protein
VLIGKFVKLGLLMYLPIKLVEISCIADMEMASN